MERSAVVELLASIESDDPLYVPERALDELEAKLAELPQSWLAHPDVLESCYRQPMKFKPASLWLYLMMAEPLGTATALHLQGRALNQGEKNAEGAIPMLRLAVRAYRLARQPEGMARAQTSLANAYYTRARYPEALTVIEPAIGFFRDAKLSFELGQALLNKIDCQLDLGDVDAARAPLEELLRTSRELFETAQDQIDETRGRINVGAGLLQQARVTEQSFGDLEEANQLCREVEQLWQPLFSNPKQQNRKIKLHLYVGYLMLRQGRHTDASRSFRIALEQLDAPPNTKDTMLEDRLDIYHYQLYQSILQRDLKAGQAAFHRMWATLQQVRSKRHDSGPRELLQQLSTMLSAAQLPEVAQEALDSRQGIGILIDEIDSILEHFTTQIEAARRHREREHTAHEAAFLARTRADGHLAQARLAYAINNPPLAAHYLAAARQQESEAPLSPLQELDLVLLPAISTTDIPLEALTNIPQQARAIGDYHRLTQIERRIGQEYERLQQPQAAISHYSNALDAAEELRKGARLSQQSIAFAEQARPIYERLAILSNHPDTLDQYWMWTEEMRAQTLRAEIDNAALLADPALSANPRLRQLRERMRKLSALLVGPVNAGTRSTTESADRHLQTEYQRIEQQYLQLHQELQSLQIAQQPWSGGKPLTRSEVQAALDPHTALLSYLLVSPIMGHQGSVPEGLYVLVVTAHNDPQLIKVMNTFNLNAFKSRWESKRNQLMGSGTSPAGAKEVLQDIVGPVLKPAIDVLPKDINQLIIIPDETMPMLPLHLAIDEQGNYLLERYTISYAPSATVLQRCRERQVGRTGASALVAGWLGDPPLSKLPYVPEELEIVAQLLRIETPEPDTLTRKKLLELLPFAAIIHLSGHGTFPAHGHPLFARLHLHHDLLYAYDLHALQLMAQLVVFSACDLGQHGTSLQGMLTAALASGACSVMGALWPVVEGKITLEVMQQFYTLARHLPVAQALRETQLHFARQDKNPYRWGSLFLMGVPDVRLPLATQ